MSTPSDQHQRDAAGDAGGVGLVVLYRWRLHPGKEAAFEDAWLAITDTLLRHGSHGSRLHRGDDGLWYGYAQWPDAATRAAAAAAGAVDAAAIAKLSACIAESLPETLLRPVADRLRLPHNRRP
jgi:Antibiotic biosynthesis monooxygenase